MASATPAGRGDGLGEDERGEVQPAGNGQTRAERTVDNTAAGDVPKESARDLRVVETTTQDFGAHGALNVDSWLPPSQRNLGGNFKIEDIHVDAYGCDEYVCRGCQRELSGLYMQVCREFPRISSL